MPAVRSPAIAIFLPSLAGGGAERMMLNLAQGLVAAGIELDLVVGSAAGPYRDLVPANCDLVDLGAGRVLTALPGLVRYLRRRRPTVLLAAMDHANLIALWARSLARVPTRVAVSVRSTLSQEARHAPSLAGRVLPRLARVFYPQACAVIAVSQGVADDLTRLIGAGRARVLVIPNPVVTPELAAQAAERPDHPWFQPGLPPAPGAGLEPAKAPVILAAGRLTPQKDFPTLIRAFARVRAGRDCRLLILGEGNARPALAALIAELGLGDQAALVGFQSNPYPYLARAALFVLSSAWEGSPNVLTEALALGIPVVATDCPSGPAEVLDGGRFGPLVPVGAVDALAAAMAATLDRPLPAAVLRSAVSEYEQGRSARRYLEVMGLTP